VCRVLPLQYDRRSFTFGQIGVGIGMRDRTERYGNASCTSDISKISCPSHVRPARQVTFCVFRPEKRIPVGNTYLSVFCASGATKVSCSEEITGNRVIGALPGKPIVNTTYTSFASISCCCSCIQPFLLLFLYATFKSYKMLSVLIISITVLRRVERSYKWRNR
jgi:hypothetical protein